MQFTGQAWGVSGGELSPVDVASSGLIGKTVPEKLLFGTVRWCLHLASDLGGSSATAGAGTGLPGPLLSTLYGARAVLGRVLRPSGEDAYLRWIEGAFRGDVGGVNFDFRTELGLGTELGRQALPVLLNEALVRGFFFVRRVLSTIQDAKPKTFKELLRIDLSSALPWRNRTIVRMLTIATSTFTAVDLVDAAVRAAFESAGQVGTPIFWGRFILRVNFVGVARTSVAVVVDFRQARNRSELRNERAAIMNAQLHLLNARSFYKVGDVWTAAVDATKEIQVTEQVLAAATYEFQSIWAGMRENSANVGRDIDRIRAENPELLDDVLDVIVWGGE
jgi:hypothetical protein